MGRLHARNVRQLALGGAPCELVHVIDRHPGRAARLAHEFDARPAAGLDDWTGNVDAAILALPTVAHLSAGRALLERGIDLLVEKPLAGSVDDAAELVARARASGRVLHVGHVEWFNPAWRAAVERTGRPRRIEVERLQPVSDRGRDIDVVQDLMLHDLDWTTRLLGVSKGRVEAQARRSRGGTLEEVEALIHLDAGRELRLVASRVHSRRVRRARIVGEAGEVGVDLLRGTVVPGIPDDPDTGVETGRDPLALQMLDFLEARRGGSAENAGSVGVEALRWVERVRAAALGRGGDAGRADDSRLRG